MVLAVYGYGHRNDRVWLAVDMGVAFGHEEVLPGVDVSRTVGWFTSVAPVRLEVPVQASLGDVLKLRILDEAGNPVAPGQPGATGPSGTWK